MTPAYHGGAKNLSLARLLQEDNETQIAGGHVRWEFRLEVEGDTASFFKHSDLFHLLDDRYMVRRFPPFSPRRTRYPAWSRAIAP